MEVSEDVGDLTYRHDPGVASYLSSVRWIINNICDHIQRGACIESAAFLARGTVLKMVLWPDGEDLGWSGWIAIGIRFNGDKHDLLVVDKLFDMMTFNIAGNLKHMVDFSNENYQRGENFLALKVFPRSSFENMKDTLFPDDYLNCVCYVNEDLFFSCIISDSDDEFAYWSHPTDESSIDDEEDYEDIFSETEENICAEGSTRIKEETEKEIGMKKLLQDLKNLYVNESITDVIVRVQDREFKSHRCILAARSPVFLAMMEHETKEKISGIIDIKDIDPDTFSDFLNYLYTGSVEDISSKNAPTLYIAADKYQVNELKKICLDYMLKNIDTDNFCDILTLSLNHEEESLRDACIQFFTKNSLDIILTSNWQTFLCENPIKGNELFIKHLQMKK